MGEFLSRWGDDMGHLGKFKSGINVDGKELWLPISNLVSICALLIWHPANKNDTITRLLFPGSTPQSKIFKGLEKLKQLECIRHPVCSASTLQDTKENKKSRGDKKMKTGPRNDPRSTPDNAAQDRKEKLLAKKKQERLRKEKEEREKERQEKEKERKEKEERERREREKEEKERREKEKEKEKKERERLERKRRAEKERREKEREK